MPSLESPELNPKAPFHPFLLPGYRLHCTGSELCPKPQFRLCYFDFGTASLGSSGFEERPSGVFACCWGRFIAWMSTLPLEMACPLSDLCWGFVVWGPVEQTVAGAMLELDLQCLEAIEARTPVSVNLSQCISDSEDLLVGLLEPLLTAVPGASCRVRVCPGLVAEPATVTRLFRKRHSAQEKLQAVPPSQSSHAFPQNVPQHRCLKSLLQEEGSHPSGNPDASR